MPLLRRPGSSWRSSCGCGQAEVACLFPPTYFSCTPFPLPQAKQQLAQLMWLRQSEDLVLEGLARLALLGEDVLRMLRI